jgi:hypothetical protein
MGLVDEIIEDRDFAKPEAAARKLLEIVLAKNIDVSKYATYIGTWCR